jgi:hypothetical protein
MIPRGSGLKRQNAVYAGALKRVIAQPRRVDDVADVNGALLAVNGPSSLAEPRRQSRNKVGAAYLRNVQHVWTWTALCADTKWMCRFFVGDRTTASAMPFIDDLKKRLALRT